MIAPLLPFSPYPGPTREKNHLVRTPTESSLIPYITQRKGEEAGPDNLFLREYAKDRFRLHYRDEAPEDRDLRGVLWARCSFNPLDERGRPTGEPQWKLMHPYRQRMTMQMLRCQVCTERARTPLGFIFLAGPRDVEPDAL